MAAAKVVTYAIQFKSNVASVAGEDADSLEALQRKLQGSSDAVKILQATQRSLKGSTDETKRAREALGVQIKAEQGAITKLQLGLLKQGTSYEQLAAKAKKAATVQKDGTDVVKAAGGPVAGLRDKLTSLQEMLTGAGGAAGITKLALLGMVTAVLAVTAAVVSGVVSLGRWILEVANAQRTAGLFREAALGSAQGAKNLGDQIDALAKKVSTPKEKINDLSLSLSKMNLSGRTIVDTLNAVTVASDAMGDDVGKKLQDAITNGQMSQHVQLSARDLLGTNVNFDELSANLAKEMGKLPKEAAALLRSGRAPIEAAAKALRKTVDKQFGEINARKMLDLNVQGQKLKETLGGLVKDVKIEPALKALDEMRKLFDSNTSTGSTLKVLVTLLGNGMVKLFTGSVPIAKAALQGFIIATLNTIIIVRKLYAAWKEAFGNDELVSRIDFVKTAMIATEVVVYAFAAALATTAAVVGAIAVTIESLVDTFDDVYEAISSAGDYLAKLDWHEMGSNIIAGLVEGIKSQIPSATGVMNSLADALANVIPTKHEQHSPSKLFYKYGRNDVLGYTGGVEDEAPSAQDAMAGLASGSAAGMVKGYERGVTSAAPELQPVAGVAPISPASMADGSSSASGGGAGRTVKVEFTIKIEGNASPQEVAKTVSTPGILAQLTKAVEDAIAGGDVVPA